MEDLERELKQATLDELEDHLGELSDVLYSKAHTEFDESDFDKIFRVVHSIKGNTRAAGYESIANVSHSYESKLIGVKTAQASYTNALHDVSLSYLHGLTDVLEYLKKDMDHPIELSSLATQLENQSEESSKSSNQTAAASPTMKNILLIDDDKDVREIIECYLDNHFDANYTHKENGQDGLDSTAQTQFDAIICDYKMPVLDGKKFIAALRSQPGINQKTPIIFLSGYKPQLEASKTTWENVFFTEKPFTESKLTYYVRCAFELSKSSQAA